MIYQLKSAIRKQRQDDRTVREGRGDTPRRFVVTTLYPRSTKFSTNSHQRQLADEADAEKAAADKAAADKATAEKAAADKAEADRDAERQRKRVETWTREKIAPDLDSNVYVYFMEDDGKYNMRLLDEPPRVYKCRCCHMADCCCGRKLKWVEKMVYGPDKKTDLAKGESELQWVQV